MSSILGRMVSTDSIDFSFFFSRKNDNVHGNRAKIRFNPDKISHSDFDGYMEMRGNFKWVSNRQIPARQVNVARRFFQKYSVLFDAVWDETLHELILQDYFRKRITWEELLAEFEVDDKEIYNEIQQCRNLNELEQLLG
jgi:hypothetical protein